MSPKHAIELREAANRLKFAGSTADHAAPRGDDRVGIYFAQMLGAVLYAGGVLLEQYVDEHSPASKEVGKGDGNGSS